MILAQVPVAATEYAFVLSTDYWSTAYYSTIGIEPPRTTDIAVEPVSTDPVGWLASNEKAYVSRYEWTTLLIVHPYTGDSLGVIDLAALADADGIPEMGRMEMVDGNLFVALNNIDRTTWQPAGPGKIAVIDTQADTLIDCDPVSPGVQPITLELPNPYSKLRYDPCRMELTVSCAGAWGEIDGGVELIDPLTLESKGVIATEAGLGGDISDAVFTSGLKWYAVVLDTAPWPDNFARLISFDRETGEVLDTLYHQTSGSGSYLAGIEINRQQELYLCDRDVADPSVRIFDTLLDTLITKIGVGVPPFDITFLQVPHAGVDGRPGTEPEEARPLTWNSPNPFRTSTRIAFAVSMPGGSHTVTWDGRDSLGRPVAGGVYFYRLRSADTSGVPSTGRMILLR
jgi:hypothetical protein